ncbi:Uncharacterised protein [Mycobacteroides abscessus subsp. abscessus]|nr:Uncharacterised protein [Mycobacteroides abscessus subsp. abscessus]
MHLRPRRGAQLIQLRCAVRAYRRRGEAAAGDAGPGQQAVDDGVRPRAVFAQAAHHSRLSTSSISAPKVLHSKTSSLVN